MKDCIGSKYDTYIEYIFFEKLEKCIKNRKTRERIRVSWLNDKELYTDLTKTIEFEFLHYSLHDASHSISILQCIYMLLGRRRIDKLSVGDLWLLLECAYSHDIEMATCYKELKELWKNDEEIEKLVQRITISSDRDIISMYKKVRDWIESEDINREIVDFFKEHSEWPLEIRKSVTYINSEYIRSQHAKRSKERIQKMLSEESKLKIEDRLYKIVGKIDYLHGTDFNEIFDILDPVAIGFETEIIHPQFIAQLLRLGDALDIRNNRFNYNNIHYQGGLVGVSNIHYKKHKSVNQFFIDDTKIQIHIESNDIDVCRNSREWLNIIEEQASLLMKYWFSIAPNNIIALSLAKIDLQVKFKGHIFDYEKVDKMLKADPKKVLDILIGSNLYSTNLICFREYLQNAIDATKMKIASEMVNDIELLNHLSIKKITDISPTDLVYEYYQKYIENNPIQIEIDFYDESKNIMNFKIIDNGIGMDEEGIKALCNIGSGWNGRANVKKLLLDMPDWLKPTAGFGIGLLSGFLLTDRLNIYTKSLKDKRYNLTIYSPESGLQIEQTIDENYYGPSGTIIEFSVTFVKYYEATIDYIEQLIKSINDTDDKLEFGFKADQDELNEFLSSLNRIDIRTNQLVYLYETIIYFVKNMILDTVLPIHISIPLNTRILNDNNIYSVESTNKLSFWDLQESVFVNINNDNTRNLLKIGYKGMFTVDKGINSLDQDLKYLSNLCFETVDIFKGKVTDILMINRNNFKSDYNLNMLIERLLWFYLEKFKENKIDKENIDKVKLIMLYFANSSLKDNPVFNDILKLLPKYYYVYHNQFKQINHIQHINEILLLMPRIYNAAIRYNNNLQVTSPNKLRSNNQKYSDLQLSIDKFIQKADNINKGSLNSQNARYKPLLTLIIDFKQLLIDNDVNSQKNTDKIKNYNILANKIIEFNGIDNVHEKTIKIKRTSEIKELISKRYVYIVINANNLDESILSKYDLEHKRVIKINDNNVKSYVEFLKSLTNISNIEKEEILLGENSYLYKIYFKDTDQDTNLSSASITDLIHESSEIMYKSAVNIDSISPSKINKYESIVLDNVHYNLDNKYIINPFDNSVSGDSQIITIENILNILKKLQNKDNKLPRDTTERKIKDIFNNSTRFLNLIEFVYFMNKEKYTRQEIKSAYLELICEVVIKAYDKRDLI